MEIKDEAIYRMKLLKLHTNVIREFKDENKLNRSEFGIGALYWLEEHEQQLVDAFQQEYEGYIVYHVIKTETRDFGIIYDLLYVAPHEEEWKFERQDLIENGIVYAYCISPFSELGPIQVKPIMGGLSRVS